ncbi:MAG: isopenicillin N synthase family oxygenase [Alphaproteobacteria bacterium]|nr:isopenicillin N synthase family oxygenase [Alphaproteobacteria bacterium]
MAAIPRSVAEPTLSDAIPVIDIAGYFSGPPAEKRAIARRIDAACRSIGFLLVSGHGVPDGLVERVHAVSRAFFDLPLEVKQLYRSKNPDVNRGYYALETQAVAYSRDDRQAPPDFRELYSIKRFEFDPADPYYQTPTAQRIFAPNIWPDNLPGFKEALTSYYRAMERLAQTLMRLFALALDLDEHWFDDKIDRHMTTFALSNYPDQPTRLRAGQLRAGAHTDYGSLTILKTEDRPGGLEVLTSAGDWKPVPIIPGTFIINIGDLMARWTNDHWVSTMHRVVNPGRDRALDSRRQSLIFFHQPNHEAIVECLPTCRGNGSAKYAPITSGEHYAMKIAKTYKV